MKPNGRVKMIQQEREANKISLPFCHLRTNKEKCKSSLIILSFFILEKHS